MKIRTNKSIDSNRFIVEIETSDFSEQELEFMQKFGEPEIDLGGSFTGPPAYSLPTNLVALKSDSPFREAFDSKDFVDAEDRANVWADEIVVRIKAAMDTLRANMDDFSGEDLETY
jgi:hypothetical protein